jgi:hypothetical protein
MRDHWENREPDDWMGDFLAWEAQQKADAAAYESWLAKQDALWDAEKERTDEQ